MNWKLIFELSNFQTANSGSLLDVQALTRIRAEGRRLPNHLCANHNCSTMVSPTMDVEVAPVQCMSYDETGVYLATVDTHGMLRMWTREADGEFIVHSEQQTTDNVTPNGIAFAPRKLGLFCATVSNQGILWIDGKEYRDTPKILRHVKFARDGTLATLGDDEIVRVYIKERDRWLLVSGLVADGNGGLAFDRTGKLLVAGKRAWRRTTSGKFVEIEHPAKRVSATWVCADWSLYGLALGADEGRVFVWEDGEVTEIQVEPRWGDVHDVRWDPAGSTIAAVHTDGVVRQWSMVGPKSEENLEETRWKMVAAPIDANARSSGSENEVSGNGGGNRMDLH